MSKEVLSKKNIILNCKSCTSDEAIKAIGQLLVDDGYIMPEYINGMLERDHSLSVYIGNELAIPHGEYDVKDYVIETGLAVMIYPEGIDWHGETAKIIVGIAANGNDHMAILSNIAIKFCEMETVDAVVASQDKDYVYDVLTKEE